MHTTELHDQHILEKDFMKYKNIDALRKIEILLKNAMKNIFIVSLVLLTSSASFAQVPKASQSLVQNSSSVSKSQKEIKVLMADIGGSPMSESSMLLPPQDWYLSKYDGAKTADSMLKDGWTLFQIIQINAKQYYWVFVK